MRKIFITLCVISLLLTLPADVAAKSLQSGSINQEVFITSTVTVDPYQPFQLSTTHIHESFAGSMGTSFYYYIDDVFAGLVSNVQIMANAGVTCIYSAVEMKVTCSTAATIENVNITFDITYKASDYAGNVIWWGWAGSYSGYITDYSIILNFPGPLTYLSYYGSDAPTSITPTQITWHKEGSTPDIQLTGYASFIDPRVKVSYLPMLLR